MPFAILSVLSDDRLLFDNVPDGLKNYLEETWRKTYDKAASFKIDDSKHVALRSHSNPYGKDPTLSELLNWIEACGWDLHSCTVTAGTHQNFIFRKLPQQG
mmetsp:Transcript_41661/g.90798  ORF Transcript_41661/g.90798 Transcript_41661/m.90798 type:complete len:101 (-) Transcript_41661:58-360(-)